MKVRHLVCGALVGAALLGLGAFSAWAFEDGVKPIDDRTPRYLDPGPWWWYGLSGDAYYAVLAPRPKIDVGALKPPPSVHPTDPAGLELAMAPGQRPGSASSPRGSNASSFASPGASSIGGGGAMALAPTAGAGPTQPDSRLVRKELETARRDLGL